MIEIAVTLAVFGLLLAMAMPSLGAWMVNARIRNTAESVHEGLQKARTEAVARNQNITFWLVSLEDPKVMGDDCALAADGGSWVVSVGDPSGQCASAPSTTTDPRIVAARPIGEGGDGVSVTSSNSGPGVPPSSITFNPLGQVVGGNPITAISVKSASDPDNEDLRRYQIVVSSGGRTLMCDEGVEDESDPRRCPN